jgi:hypothetical protein
VLIYTAKWYYDFRCYFVLVAHKVGASALISHEGVSEDDQKLLDCLDRVSYAKASVWSLLD